MESKKYNSVSKKIAKWVKGKPQMDYESSFLPERSILEEYLNGNLVMENPDPIMKVVKIHSAIGYYGYWHYCNFLEQYFAKTKTGEYWNYWVEGAVCRILQYTLGYAYPQNIAPIDDGKIALAICDSIIFNDHSGEKIVTGYTISKDKKRPLRNPQSVIQYSFNIYHKYQSEKKFDFSVISAMKMTEPYLNLFSHIESSDDLFDHYFEEACEFHLERSRNSMLYEFSWEEDMLIPSELLATLSIRQQLGFTCQNISHPLVTPFLTFLKDNNHTSVSPFLKNIRQRVKKDFFPEIE